MIVMINKYKILDKYKETKKSSLFVYLFLRILVIICFILEIINGNISNAIICILSLILFTLPGILQAKTKIELPNLLEIIIYLFIFAAGILGSINNFYEIIPHWDTMLHMINGFICAGVGFSLVNLLNENSKNFSLSPIFLVIVSFCFSMTIGVCWEFIEFGADQILNHDNQRDRVIKTIKSYKINDIDNNEVVKLDNIKSTTINLEDGNKYEILGGYLDIGLIDTMKDLIVNMIGAIIFNLIGYIYLIKKDNINIFNNLLPKRKPL